MANINEMVGAIIERLAKDTGISASLAKKHRVHITEPEFNSWNIECKRLTTLSLTDTIKFALYEFQGDKYLLASGLDSFENNRLEAFDDIVVLSLDFIYALNLQRIENVSEYYLQEYVFFGDGTYTAGVDYSIIGNCFPKITTFRIKDVVSNDDAKRLYELKIMAYYALCQNKSQLLLSFDDNTILEYTNIANDSNDNYPIDYLIRSLISNSWKSSFLDVYRCIERLYGLAFIDSYRRGLQSPLSVSDVLTVLRNVQDNRLNCHENINIEHLISLLPQHLVQMLTPLCNGEKHARWVYKTRNESVHFQTEEKPVDRLNEDEWNVYFQFLLKSILYLYNALDDYLKEQPDFYGLK